MSSIIILVGCVVLVFCNAWLFRETRRLRGENRKLIETLAHFERILTGRAGMIR